MAQDYIQYHNTDKLGWKPTSKGKRVGIFWMGRRSVPIGARVWLVAGETIGRTKSYWIYDWFVADKVDSEEREASGAEFVRFKPPVEIGKLPWFKEFQTYMGNFGRGLSPLRKVDIANFEQAVRATAPAAKPKPSRRIGGGGFGTPEQNREVEIAAVEAVRTHFHTNSWKVISVESENRGYDLLCTLGKRELHVEVKGMAGAGPPTCILSENERSCSLADPNWQLIIVGSALDDPVLHVFTATEIADRFTLAPIAYRLTQK